MIRVSATRYGWDRELALAAQRYAAAAAADAADYEAVYNHGLALQELATRAGGSPSRHFQLLTQANNDATAHIAVLVHNDAFCRLSSVTCKALLISSLAACIPCMRSWKSASLSLRELLRCGYAGMRAVRGRLQST